MRETLWHIVVPEEARGVIRQLAVTSTGTVIVTYTGPRVVRSIEAGQGPDAQLRWGDMKIVADRAKIVCELIAPPIIDVQPVAGRLPQGDDIDSSAYCNGCGYALPLCECIEAQP